MATMTPRERQGGLRRAEIGSRVQNGYVSPGTGGYARPPQERKNRPVSSNKVPAHAREWTRVPYLSFPRMKGSPVRVRASALTSLQGFLRRRQRRIAAVGYETGTSSERFTVSEGVPPPSRFSLISRQFGPGGGSGWLDRSARKCPRVDARDWLLFTVEAPSPIHRQFAADRLDRSDDARVGLSQTCSRR